MSKIIVTGGAGFIGSTLVDKLISEGHEVVVIDSLISGKQEYLNPLAKFYQLDICSPEVAKVFEIEQPEYVYHLAAQIDVRKSVEDYVEDNRVNVLGGVNILENCRQFKVKKFIFSSTGGAIYGDSLEIPTTENAPAYPVSPYGIHKLTLEKYCNYYYQVYGLNYTVLRFANVYGPRQYKGGEAGVVAIFIDHGVSGNACKQYGDGLQTRDYVYVDDVVAALSAAKSVDYNREINIGCGLEISLLQVIEAIESALGAKLNIEVLPGKPGEQRRSVLSYNKAKKILNFEPTIDINEGVKRTVAWTKSLKQ